MLAKSIGRHDGLHPTTGQKALRGQQLAAEQQAAPQTHADPGHQAHARPSRRKQPVAHVPVADQRPLRSHDDIADQRQLEPTGDDVTVQRRDDRLRAAPKPRHARRHLSQERRGVAVALGHGKQVAQIRPRAEAATAAGEHDDLRAGILGGGSDLLIERGEQPVVDRIEALRAVEQQPAHRAGLLDLDGGCLAHDASSTARCRRRTPR